MHIAYWAGYQARLGLVAKLHPQGVLDRLAGLDGDEVGGRLAAEVDFVDGILIVLAEGEDEEDPGHERDALGRS